MRAPGNAFWPTLFDVGLISRRLSPLDYALLPHWKLGLTDLAKHVSGSDSVLARDHFDRQRLRGLIAVHRPRWVAFTGKRAAAEFLGHPVPYGLLTEVVGTSRLFVLPSTLRGRQAALEPRVLAATGGFARRSRVRLDAARVRRVLSRPLRL